MTITSEDLVAAPTPLGATTAGPATARDAAGHAGLSEAWPADRRTRRRALPRSVRRFGGPLLLVAAWQLLSSFGVVDERTLAAPWTVLQAGWELIEAGELHEHILVSFRRAMLGVTIGVTVGVALAVVAGLFRLGEDLVDSSMQVLRSVPVLGLLPLVIIWFGIGEQPKVALVAIGTMFPIYINTYAGIRGVDVKLVETATTFGVSKRGLVRHVVIPGAVPNFLVGLRFALTGAWLILIVAEQINARSGLGFLINEGRTWFRTDIIVLGLAIYGVLGLATDYFVRFLERRLLSWRRGFEGT
jgi:sulfonate transport system permease protein